MRCDFDLIFCKICKNIFCRRNYIDLFHFVEEVKKKNKEERAREAEELKRKKEEEMERKVRQEMEHKVKEDLKKDMEEKIMMAALPKEINNQVKFTDYLKVTHTYIFLNIYLLRYWFPEYLNKNTIQKSLILKTFLLIVGINTNE